MGNYLTKPNTHKRTLTGQNLFVRFGSSEMQGWRLSMEDAKLINLALDENTMIFGIFDGHGGREVSEYVSRHFTYEFLSCSQYEANDIPNALIRTFYRMDELLLTPEGSKELTRISKNLPSSYPAKEKKLYMNKGCTAIVVLIRNNEIFVANAGDSRCILNRNGVAVSLSTDHKPSLLSEMNRIIDAGAKIIDGRINGGLNLTRAIGDFKYKNIPNLPKDRQSVICEPEIVRVNLEDEDKFLVIGCDGVWERIGSQDCVNIVQEKIDKGFGLGVVAEEILDRAISPKVTNGLGCDNMTIIIVAFLCWGYYIYYNFFLGFM